MNKRIETTKTDARKTDVIETIETIALDTVTGGCSSCGCGQPDATAAQQQQVFASWLRR
jgi:hypothetical protein